MNGSRAFPSAMEHRLPQKALLHDGCTSRDGGDRTGPKAGPAHPEGGGAASHRQVSHAAAHPPASVTPHPRRRRSGSPPESSSPGAGEAFDVSLSALTAENTSNNPGPHV